LNYVRFFSENNAGLNETIKSELIKIDKTAPITNGSITSGTLGLNDWYTTNVVYTIVPEDTVSGIDITAFCIDDDDTCEPLEEYTIALTLSTEGNNYVRYRSIDKVGHVQDIQSSGLIKIDKTAPVILTDLIINPRVNYNSNLTFNFNITDLNISNINVSVNGVQVFFEEDINDVFFSENISYNVSTFSTAKHNVTFRSVDEAGNVRNDIYYFYMTDFLVNYENEIISGMTNEIKVTINTTGSSYAFNDVSSTIIYDGETLTTSKTFNNEIFIIKANGVAKGVSEETNINITVILEYINSMNQSFTYSQKIIPVFLGKISANESCPAGYSESLRIFGWDEIETQTPVIFDGNIAFDLLTDNNDIFASVGFELRKEAGLIPASVQKNETYEFNSTNATLTYYEEIASDILQTTVLVINGTAGSYTHDQINATMLYAGVAKDLIKTYNNNIFTFTSESFASKTVESNTTVNINYTITYSNSQTETINVTQLVKPIEPQLGSNYTICLYPADATIKADVWIEYNSEDYSERKYFLNQYTLNNVTNNLSLYLLDDVITSDIIISLFDRNTGIPITDAIVKMQRYYPQDAGTDFRYRTVQIEQSDATGKLLMKAVLGDVWYRFIIEKPIGNVIFMSDIERILSVNKDIPISQTTGTLLTYNEMYKMSGNVRYNVATQTFTFIWSNPSNTDVTGTLKVFQDTGARKLLIHNASVTSSSATIAYTIPGNITNQRYYAEGWIQP